MSEKNIYPSNLRNYFLKDTLLDYLNNYDVEVNKNNEFIKYYFFTKIFIIFYSNFLEYIDHPDFLNNDIDNFNDKFKNNLQIIKKLYICSKSKKILNILNPFFIKKININDNLNVNNIVNTIYTILCRDIPLEKRGTLKNRGL